MVNINRRCKYCNWLNKEVPDKFSCKNCKKQNHDHKDEVIQKANSYISQKEVE